MSRPPTGHSLRWIRIVACISGQSAPGQRWHRGIAVGRDGPMIDGRCRSIRNVYMKQINIFLGKQSLSPPTVSQSFFTSSRPPFATSFQSFTMASGTRKEPSSLGAIKRWIFFMSAELTANGSALMDNDPMYDLKNYSVHNIVHTAVLLFLIDFSKCIQPRRSSPQPCGQILGIDNVLATWILP